MAEAVVEHREGIASTVPAHPLLFAFYPVERLYAQNTYEVSIFDVVVPLLVVLGATLLAQVVLSILMRDVRRAAIVTSAGVVVVMMFGLVEDSVRPDGDLRPLLLIASAAFIVGAVVLAWRLRSELGRLTLGLNVIALMLVLVAAAPSVQGAAAEVADTVDDVSDGPAAARDADASQRDIYHLVLDRYGSEASLAAERGIDNSAFVDWLREQGFQVVDDAHANYTKTTLSLGSTLGMRPIDDIAAKLGPDSENLAPVVRRIQHSRAGQFLQDQGYEYVHIGSWFNQTRDSKVADRSYSPETGVSFGTTLWDQTVLPALVARPPRAEESMRRHADAATYQMELLEALAEQPGLKYVLAHILLPHQPYVFLEDGTYDLEGATFETQLTFLNTWLEGFVESLQALPEEERPIIILQADEGPFPRAYRSDPDGFDWSNASEAELLSKFGIISAMYLPGEEGEAPLPEGMSAVNTYPELFERYFGADFEHYPDRVLASTRARPYDLVDVTDRLEATRSQ